MSLGGELHGVGYEVGQHLLDTSDVEVGVEVVERTVFLELHVGVLYALSQGDTDILEGQSEVGLLRFDGEGTVTDTRSLDDIVDEALQHVGAVVDDTHILAALR